MRSGGVLRGGPASGRIETQIAATKGQAASWLGWLPSWLSVGTPPNNLEDTGRWVGAFPDRDPSGTCFNTLIPITDEMVVQTRTRISHPRPSQVPLSFGPPWFEQVDQQLVWQHVRSVPSHDPLDAVPHSSDKAASGMCLALLAFGGRATFVLPHELKRWPGLRALRQLWLSIGATAEHPLPLAVEGASAEAWSR
eukprot:5628738-Alexandrium_andersonii.AAC.1